MIIITDLRRKGDKTILQKLFLAVMGDILHIDPVEVVVVDGCNMSSSTHNFTAVVEKLSKPHAYRLYLAEDIRYTDLEDAVCHEAIHISQYEAGRLSIASDRKSLTFEERTYYPPYDSNHPHEREAFAGMVGIRKQLRKLMK